MASGNRSNENEPRVSVVIPTLNEADNLPFVMSTLSGCDYEIFVVDGRSKDDTERVASALWPDVKIIREELPGKGAALQAGFAAATGDIIVMLDADGSADGREIPAFVEALVDGADFAKGSRFMTGGGSADITAIRGAGNKALTLLVNVMFGASFSDLCYGYNAFWRRCLPFLNVDCAGFEVETLLMIRAQRSGLRITEVSSYESVRIHGTSNLHAVRDGLRVLRTIVTEARDSPLEGPEVSSDDARTARIDPPVGENSWAISDSPTQNPHARRVCVVGPGGHAPVHGVVTGHFLHKLSADAHVSSLDSAIPGDVYDRTLLGTFTSPFPANPTASASVSPIPALRRRDARRFFLREHASVVVLDWWSESQLPRFADVAAAAKDVNAQVVLRCCGSLTLDSVRHRLAMRRVAKHVDLIVTHGFRPALLCPHDTRIVDIRELRMGERSFDPERLDVLVFLPHDGIEAARVMLAAFEALSEKRAGGYRVEIAWSNKADLAVLEGLIEEHHYAQQLSILTAELSDLEVERRLGQGDAAILIDPPTGSRALESVEHSGLPVVIVRTDDNTARHPYPGAAQCSLDSASVLSAVERASLARRYHYPSAERWSRGVARFVEVIESLHSLPQLESIDSLPSAAKTA